MNIPKHNLKRSGSYATLVVLLGVSNCRHAELPKRPDVDIFHCSILSSRCSTHLKLLTNVLRNFKQSFLRKPPLFDEFSMSDFGLAVDQCFQLLRGLSHVFDILDPLFNPLLLQSCRNVNLQTSLRQLLQFRPSLWVPLHNNAFPAFVCLFRKICLSKHFLEMFRFHANCQHPRLICIFVRVSTLIHHPAERRLDSGHTALERWRGV